MKRLQPYLLGIFALFGAEPLAAQSPYKSNEDFAKYAMKLREAAISSIEPRVVTPTQSPAYSWRTGIVTTVFWVGESASTNNPVHNRSSSWDADWASSYGGYDNPDPGARHLKEFRPLAFVPRQNPFYYALPYNDVTRGTTKPESRDKIPWFRSAFVREGQSVCRDRWIAIRNPSNRRMAYAQWSDCGPFRTDHIEYVFGNEKPKPNLNRGAGLDVSPSVRDFLGLSSTDVTDWRFIEPRDVPPGPWDKFGDNNHFVQRARRVSEQVARATNTPATEPTVRTR